MSMVEVRWKCERRRAMDCAAGRPWSWDFMSQVMGPEP